MKTFILSKENWPLVMRLLAEFLKDYTISMYAFSEEQTEETISIDQAAEGWCPYALLKVKISKQKNKIERFGKINPWDELSNDGVLARLGDKIIINHTNDARKQKSIVILHTEQEDQLPRKASMLIQTGLVVKTNSIVSMDNPWNTNEAKAVA